jgi:hypothetical protein
VNISPNAGAGQRALAAVREHLDANGWEITTDEHQYAWFYRLGAVRDDGVRLSFEVGSGMTRLTATTGCIEHAPDSAAAPAAALQDAAAWFELVNSTPGRPDALAIAGKRCR